MRRRRKRVAVCSFCDEPGSHDRLLVGGMSCAIICEDCITLAVARIAETRGR
jgi:hypothetical protein